MMKAAGSCDDSEPIKRLDKTLQNWQNINQNSRPCAPEASPLTSALSQAKMGTKTIMTQLAATQLSHCSIMSENEIDLKILRRPRLEQKGLLC